MIVQTYMRMAYFHCVIVLWIDVAGRAKAKPVFLAIAAQIKKYEDQFYLKVS